MVATASDRAPGREVGEVVAGRYRVDGRLGAGGMGTVYGVDDASTGKKLALKEFGGRYASAVESAHRLRFRLEFHTIARLSHPRIVKAFDYGLDADVPYYTMELLDGQDLVELHDVPPPRACALLRDVASGLAFLHARRLIHRDLAPRNVRCTADGRAKLIDFGLLSTAGYTGDVAGTPPLISPENVRGLPLDHRADLYSLGALAYWLVAGRHAYPARTIDELDALWRTRPLPPSAYAEGVPAALDDLILSLLSLDPLARPRAAAEVIDRLTAVGGLPHVQDADVAGGYLASAALVGRQREIAAMKKRLERTLVGEGGAVVLEAPSGRGKSRLLREIALEAQVAGATVLSANSDTAGRGPYGLFRALARSLLATAPVEAITAARPYAGVLSRVVPEVLAKTSLRDIVPSTANPEEERMRMQQALLSWFRDVALVRPLVLLVDDVQRADEASAATLTALAYAGKSTPLLVVVAVRTDEPIRASFAIQALSDVAQRIRVRALDAADVEELVRGTFGDVHHLARLADWMQRTSGGSPLHCFELARHLVDRGVVRYEAGVWLVPEEPDIAGMPEGLEAAMDLRVAALSPRARGLAEVLSVHGGALPLLLCVDIAQLPREEDVFVALDELVFEEVLIGAEDRYRFRHDALREALLRGLGDERRRDLHLRVGRALLATGDVEPELEAEVGWHLFRGGERTRAADLLERAGRRLYEAQSFRDALPSLEAALDVREAEGAPVRDILAIRHRLVMGGFFGDRQVALRYGDATVDALRSYSGMSTASSLSRFVPRAVALALGVTLAFLRWLVTRRGPSPLEALWTFYVEVAYFSVARSFSFHVPEVRALRAMLEPMRAFAGRTPEGAYLIVALTTAMPLGRFGDARRVAERSLAIFRSDHVTPIAESDRLAAFGATLGGLAFAAVQQQDPRCLDLVVEFEKLGLRYFETTAELIRVVYRRARGEEDLAREIESRLDVLLVQSGAMWGPESQLTWLSALAFALTRDVLGLRRAIAELQTLLDAGFRVRPMLDLTRGEYLRERGELAEARSVLEASLSALDPEDSLVRVPALGALAEVKLAQLDPEGAIALAEEAIRIASDPAVVELVGGVRASRVLGLAHAARGDFPRARATLDAAIDQVAHLGSPSVSGSLHEARARVAFAESDAEAYVLHRHATEAWFRPTKNPALIARFERLPDPALAAHPSSPEGAESATVVIPRDATTGGSAVLAEGGVTVAERVDVARWSSAVLEGCRGPSERAEKTLELFVEGSGSASGYLYLRGDDGFALAAPRHGEEPPAAVLGMLDALTRADAASQIASDPPPGQAPRTSALGVQLRVEGHGRSEVVGAVILVGAPNRRMLRRDLVAQVTRALHDAGDVTARSLRISED